MIDRKALRIFGISLFAMIAATLLRLSLYPDWRQIPAGSHNTVSGLFLFVPAGNLLFMMTVPFYHWLTSSKETLPARRRWSGQWIVSWSVFAVLMQAFVLARSLGLVSPSGIETARGGLVLIGIILMMTGNAIPKTPLPSHHNSTLELDLWQQSRMLRFTGKVLVGVGLAFALGGLFLPLELWQPIFLCLMLGALAAGIWYHVKLHREASPLP
jgi:hypothetical protein